MRTFRFLIVALVSVVLSGTAGAQTVHKLDPTSASLGELMEQATLQIGSQDAYIVFSFSKEMCSSCATGWLRWDSEWVRTIEDVILEREPAGTTVQDAARRTLNELDGNEADSERMVMKEIAILVRMENGSVADVKHANITTPFKFEGSDVYWLGKHNRTDILALYDHDAWSRFDEDTRTGWVWTIGALELGGASLTWLKRAYQGEDSIEVRKATAFAMGGMDSEAAVRALKQIIESDPEREVQKAAIYAIGNNESKVARETLLEIIRTMGTTSSS